MNKIKNILVIILCIFSTNSFAYKSIKLIKIGVTAGPHADILEFVAVRAKQLGLNLQIIEFNDFVLPNIALSEGDLDLNVYQHELYLNEQIKDRGYNFVNFGKNIFLPMGIYSNTIKNITDLKKASIIAIPNDPSNSARALLLLEKIGLIKLKFAIINPSILDIIENTKNLKIIELEAPQLARALIDVDLSVINMDWVLLAGIDCKTALVIEDLNALYTNLFVVEFKNKDNKDIKKLIEIYQSEETKQFIINNFGYAVIAAW